jgi:ATP/maltotriose-dependent transcriptional regulator MalT
MAHLEPQLTAARQAYARGEWDTAHRALMQARSQGELATADLDLLGSTLWWVGDTRQSLALAEDVFHRYLDDGDAGSAAAKAVNLALLWFVRGDLAIASGWVSRARRILQDLPEGPDHGYLLYLEASLGLEGGDLDQARAAANQLDELSRRLHAPPLNALGLVLSGLADLREAKAASGFAQLDEAMLPVLAGQMPPEWAGDIYCTVIHACHALADLTRMSAWTRSTEQWCGQFQGEVVYSGICRIHRLQLQCVEGRWEQAEQAIERSGEDLIGRNNWVAGEAYYQLGELRRLRGDGDGARSAFAQARDLGAEPQPGEALLHHAEGSSEQAWAGLCAALAGRDRLAAAGLLGAGVEIAVALGYRDEAEHLCTALEATAEAFGTTGFRAWAAQSRARVLVDRHRYRDALPVLRAAAADYRALNARYETARIHELLARTHRGLGESGAAAADAAQALAIFRFLGAAPDVRRMAGGAAPGGLTDREVEVLRWVAAGASNKAVAEALFISQKTVGRHLANIFAKIGVTSRTAAAAWGHEHGLTEGR